MTNHELKLMMLGVMEGSRWLLLVFKGVWELRISAARFYPHFMCTGQSIVLANPRIGCQYVLATAFRRFSFYKSLWRTLNMGWLSLEPICGPASCVRGNGQHGSLGSLS